MFTSPIPTATKTQQAISKTSVDPTQVLPVASVAILAERLVLHGHGNRAPVMVYQTSHTPAGGLARRQNAIVVPAGGSVEYPIPTGGQIDLSTLRYQGEGLQGVFTAKSSAKKLLSNGGALVPVTTGPATTGVVAGDWNSYTVAPLGTQQWLATGQACRIRQTGTVRRVKFYISATQWLETFQIQIWRRAHSAGTNAPYMLVGETENLAPRIMRGVNDLLLNSPVTGVQEGDFYGIKAIHSVTTSGSHVAWMKTEAQTGALIRFVRTAHSNTSFRWEEPGSVELTTAASADTNIPVGLYMDAPVIAGIGDSLMAGHNSHYTGLETTLTHSPSFTFLYQLGLLYGTGYQNLGIGGQTTTLIAARIADLVAVQPKIALLNGGVNDIDGGAINQATFIANWTAMLTACRDAGIIPVVLQMWPWTAGTNGEMQTRDTWRTALAALVATYPTALLADLDATLGKNRGGGDPGNLWDLQTSPDYNDDDIHVTAAANVAAAAALKTLIDAHLASQYAL